MQKYTRNSLWAALACTLLASTVSAAPIIGGQVYSLGNSVTVDIVSASAAFVSDVNLYSPLSVAIGNNTYTVGNSVPIGGLNANDELVFGIYVNDTGNTFQMGPGSRNGDLLAHAAVTWLSPTMAEIGFEDINGGGDLDYNDVIIRVEGVGPGRGQPTPEPATMAIWGLMAGAGLLYRRRTRNV